MIELIVTIIVLAILAAVAAPKFFGTSKFDELGFTDVIANGLRYAHKMAISTGCDTRAAITATEITLYQRDYADSDCSTGNFTTKVKRIGGYADKPAGYVESAGGPDWVEAVPDGLTVSALDIYFDNVGRPYTYTAVSPYQGTPLSGGSVTVGSRTINIEAETGFIRQ